MRPVRVRGVAVVTALLALAFFGVSRTSGAGWATVLVAVLTGALATGALLPAMSLGRSELHIETPTDATATLPIEIHVTGKSGLVAEVPELGSGRFVTGAGRLTVHPPKRGVIIAVTTTVWSAAPLGMVEWRRRFTTTLAQPIEVGPLPEPQPYSPDALNDMVGHDSVRGIRDYEAGDSPKSIHWPATARAGHLLVRQFESPRPSELRLVVDLIGNFDADEAAASRAAGIANAALGIGTRVVLTTTEVVARVEGQVSTALDVSRRLARAVTAVEQT